MPESGEKWHPEQQETDPEKQVHVQEQKNIEDSKESKEGWLKVNQLAKSFGVAIKTITNEAEKYRPEHPEWFNEAHTTEGRYIVLHPDLISIIRSELEKREAAPPGWMTKRQIGQSINRDAKTVEGFAEKFREEHPDWFKAYSSSGGLWEYYHPDLISLIRHEIEAFPSAPPGWVTKSGLGKEIGLTYEAVEQTAEKYRAEHADWFHYYSTGFKRNLEYYHPDLAKIIRDEVVRRELVPAGWQTNGAISSRLSVGFETTKKVADNYRNQHPEWFADYDDGQNRTYEYFSPELIKIINTEIEKIKVPDGWATEGSLAARTKTVKKTIEHFVEKYRLSNPEWFLTIKRIGGVEVEYFHPDLVSIVISDFEKRISAPDSWLTISGISEFVGFSRPAIKRMLAGYRQSHPEWFANYLDRAGRMNEHYHPDLVAIIKAEIGRRREAPAGWVTNGAISESLGTSFQVVENAAAPYRILHPEWFGNYKTTVGTLAEHFHPDLAEAIKAEISRREDAPAGWITNRGLSDVVKVGEDLISRSVEIYRQVHPEWFRRYKSKSGKEAEHYHPDLVAIIKTDIGARKLAPDGWANNNRLSEELGASPSATARIAGQYRKSHPEWFVGYKDGSGSIVEYFNPDLVSIIALEIKGRQLPPQGWMTRGRLWKALGRSDDLIGKISDKYRDSHPEWFRRYFTQSGITEHYAPDLVELIIDEVTKKEIVGILKEKENSRKLELQDFLSEVNNGKTATAKQFESLINVLGGSRVMDILYKFRPEYKGLPPEYVKGILADYLGDFLVKPQKFTLDNIEVAVEYLSDLSLREGLFETLKEHCLRYYFDERRKDPTRASQDVIYDYLDEIVEKLHHLNSKDLDDVIQDVIRYYDSVLKDFHKPEQFVGSLDPNREFPDINQRINMKELAEKKRLLIADEMGLGKSASVIMAKEQLGIGCALVVAPSNVVSTWKRYLSDRSEDGGYFKLGEAPRVLEVSSVDDLIGVAADQYDYILISQERMNERYSEALSSIDYDMLVVDEIHKLKSLEGRRTSELMELSKKVDGEGKYLAMLSGTPAPNKVEDIAISLKLLYPEKFAAWDDRDLIRQIIQGDLVDLRSLLLPRMQAKKLEEGVEMPELHEEKIETELSPMEMDIYEVLLEDDELEASPKMMMLRQFLMNPDLLDATPGIKSAKIERVASDLRECFTKNNKAVLFVNGYIEGVIRGKDNIIAKFGLPEDIEVRVIHGGNRDERELIQKEFKETSGKMLLVVSGQTADVGVDFTSAETVFTYNEPWTEYDRRQQVSRVYRPGLKHDLDVRTFITKNTLEEGIHEYIGRKYQAIEKLLHGIPIQELEKQLLSEDEKSNNPDLEVNKELAEYYFSSWDKLMRIFAHVKEIGEEDFKEFLSEYGKDYADCYLDLGNRSYQANANRVTGTLIGSMLKERGGRPEETLVLDVASGPEMLRQHIGNELQEQVISVDANPFHFKAKEGQNVQSAVASWRELPFREKSFDYLNLALALHYSNFVPSKGKLERLEVLKEANRVLKPGGRAVISFIYSLDLRDVSKFHEFAEGLGFKVVDEYSGEVAEGDEYKSRIITLEKTADFNGTPESVLDKIDVKDYSGLKFKKTDAKLKGQRNIIDQFDLHGRKFDVDFNAHDSEVRIEEQEMLAQGNALKEKYGGVINIPKSEIIDNKFVRIRVGEKYLLFKKLEKGSGVVIVK